MTLDNITNGILCSPSSKPSCFMTKVRLEQSFAIKIQKISTCSAWRAQAISQREGVAPPLLVLDSLFRMHPRNLENQMPLNCTIAHNKLVF